MVLLTSKYGPVAIGVGNHGIMAVGLHLGWGVAFKVDGNKPAFVL